MKRWLILGFITGFVQAGTVEVRWNCDVGRDEDGYLPKSRTVSVEVDNSERVKFHPDIFKTGSSFSSFFMNAFSKRSINRSVDYSSCMRSFSDNFRIASAQYKTQNCTDLLKRDRLCTTLTDQVQDKFQAKLNKSLFLEPVAQLIHLPVDPRPQTTEVVPPQKTPSTSVVPSVDQPSDPYGLPIPTQPRPSNGKFLTFIGGGGEPDGATTIFDGSLSGMTDLVTTPDWQTNVIFNGGHSTTEALVASAFPGKPVSNFTAQTYSSMIQDYLQKIERGDIKPGDQIMLVVNTHGGPHTEPNLTHSIATSETHDASGKGLGTVSIDELKKVRDAAEAKGIKLAITDMSCYSGLSQALGTDKTCVISATGKLNYAAAGGSADVFSNKFLANLKPGRNLEDIFLQTRSTTGDPGFPEISTSAGRDISSELYPILFRYQMVENKNGGRLFRQLSLDVKNSYYKDRCETEADDIRKLDLLSNQVQDIFKPNMTAVKNAVLDYQRYRQDIYKRLDDLHADQLRGSFTICDKAVVTWTSDGCTKYDNVNVLTNNWDGVINSYKTSLAYKPADQAKAIAFY
jgi:hypothetical protein